MKAQEARAIAGAMALLWFLGLISHARALAPPSYLEEETQKKIAHLIHPLKNFNRDAMRELIQIGSPAATAFRSIE